MDDHQPKQRGRPKGSKNKPKDSETVMGDCMELIKTLPSAESIDMILNDPKFESVRKALCNFEKPMLTEDEVELPPLSATFEPKDFLTFYRSIKDRLDDGKIP
jgi:hypothetical protein